MFRVQDVCGSVMLFLLTNLKKAPTSVWTSSKSHSARSGVMSEKAVKISHDASMSRGPQLPYHNGKPSGDAPPLSILGLDLTVFSPAQQFLLCCAGIFFFYLIYGYIQELIFSLEGFKPFGWYLALVQFGFYTVFGIVERQLKADTARKVPLCTYALLAFLTVSTMGLSNSSLGYLNYPTQVIFKCCKLIPVLIGGILIQGKSYNLYDWSACVCMSVGLIFFTLADSTVQPSFSMYGVTLISLALCADAMIGNVQEKVMKQYSGSNAEIVLYSYGIGTVYILLGQVLSGQLIPAFTFCLQYPIRTYAYAFVFSFTGYCGGSIVLTLVKTSGALIAVTVTTTRKAITIVLSFILFTKPFTYQYLWSGLVVVLGIYLNIYSKNQAKMDACINSFIHKHLYKRRSVYVNTMENVV